MIMFMQLKAVQIDRTKIVYESNCSIVFDKYIEQLY
jgi:predicted transcriptional regulator